MALKTQRALSEKVAPSFPSWGYDVAEGVKIYRGAIVGICADGTLAPAGSQNLKSPIIKLIGVAKQDSFQANMEGGYPIDIHNGCLALPFDKDPTWADIGKPVYAVDDEFVTLTNPSPAPAEGQTAPNLQLGTFAGMDRDGTPYTFIWN